MTATAIYIVACCILAFMGFYLGKLGNTRRVYVARYMLTNGSVQIKVFADHAANAAASCKAYERILIDKDLHFETEFRGPFTIL